MPARTFELFVRAARGRADDRLEAGRREGVCRPPSPQAPAIPRRCGDPAGHRGSGGPRSSSGRSSEGQIGAMALGVEYVPAKLKHGTTGDITLSQDSMVPSGSTGAPPASRWSAPRSEASRCSCASPIRTSIAKGTGSSSASTEHGLRLASWEKPPAHGDGQGYDLCVGPFSRRASGVNRSGDR